jgi:hypothetical protein
LVPCHLVLLLCFATCAHHTHSHMHPPKQAGSVGGTPIICIGLAPGQSGAARSEQQLLAEVQSMRLGGGQAGAAGGEEPQVLLVGADLPGTPRSSKSELSGLAMQLSGGSATTTSTMPGGLQPAAAAALPLQDEPLPVVSRDSTECQCWLELMCCCTCADELVHAPLLPCPLCCT